MKHEITIDNLIKFGAPNRVLDYMAKAFYGDFNSFIEKKSHSLPYCYLWLVANGFDVPDDPYMLYSCAYEEPAFALEFCYEKLGSPRTKETIAYRDHVAAMRYCADKLDPAVLKKCALKWSSYALRYCAEKLDKETLSTCIRKFPAHALEYCSHLLDDETIKRCALLRPRQALVHCPNRFDDAMVKLLKGML